MIKYVKGDVFQSGADIIAHGVNSRGAFGSGVAGVIARNHPHARDRYLDKFQKEGWELGEVQFVSCAERINSTEYIWIANCNTQDDYGYQGACLADYPAIRQCMIKVRRFAVDNGFTIAMPKIGCGLAGGNWETVKAIMEEVFKDYEATVYHLD